MLAENAAPPSEPPARIAQRYDVHELLGQGGMARVYRVTDLVTGREAALKQLLVPAQAEQALVVNSLFEREFHTLAQLSHPRVIAVYDYGVEAGVGPYYTMELLDGGDLRDRAPLPWREACQLLFGVCSSLALLHSRRLLHRDVSPRNVRCTRDGQAKLIDFGAMAPMGAGGAQIVGTPAFTPPETVHRAALDDRADLFSLGATLYYALTGKMAFPARTFSEVLQVWESKPVPPSSYDAAVPAALDDLVGALLSIEPALRPRNAFEVMQRLAAIAELPGDEDEAVSRAYLATPVLIGREQTLDTLRERIGKAIQGRGGGVIIRAAPGLGRSRVLDACGLSAKTLGATVLRSTASGSREGFSVALGLVQHLLETLPVATPFESYPELFEPTPSPANENGDAAGSPRPRLKNLAALRVDASRLRHAITRLLWTVSTTHPLVITVDNVERIDEPSASVLAALLDKGRRGSVLVAMTLEDGAAHSGLALDVLTRRCEQLSLSTLTREQTESLFGSVFGDVPNLQLLSREIHRIAVGNPRASMQLAQHLIDQRSIQYSAGTWSLPSQLSAADLPGSVEEALHARCDALQPVARLLAEAQALAFYPLFRYEQYHALCHDHDPRVVDAAILELVSKQVLASDGEAYSLANSVWASALTTGLSTEQRMQRHRALSELYRDQAPLGCIHHAFAGGLDELGLDLLVARHREHADSYDLAAALEMNAANMGPSYERAIETAVRLGRPARVVNELKRWVTALGVAAGAKYYWSAAPGWLAQLERDSGLSFWREDTGSPAGERLTRALQRAAACYLATPEHERVYRVDEAIRNLAQYVAVSLAIGARSMDAELVSSLPELLEPFAALSPVVEAIWQNAVASREANRDGQYERARARWIEVHGKLEKLTGSELQHVEVIRNAVAYAIGMTEAILGLASAADWADRIDRDPMQKLSALHLRKILRLEHGDWVGAERVQRQAEVEQLQARSPQMFTLLRVLELACHAHARDLVGVKQVVERIRELASQHPGWVPYLRLAEARFELARGDWASAAVGFEQTIAMVGDGAQARPRAMQAWIAAHSGLCEALVELGQAETARVRASAANALCAQWELGAAADDLTRTLALAEARVGIIDQASARLDALIARQTALGVSGLKLGLSYEARAQVAISSDDARAFDRYARLTAQAYRYGARSPLGARYERLMNDATRCGFKPPAGVREVAASTTSLETSGSGLSAVSTLVTQALSRARSREERFSRALQLVCQARAAHGGHCFELQRDGLLALASSHGLDAPTAALLELAREHMLRADDSSMMATRAVSRDTPNSSAIVEADGVKYELLLLACAGGHERRIAGVMAITSSIARAQTTQQAQLLAAIAAELLR
jgi:hypothetical protein